MFFIWCDIIFLVRIQEKFEIDHTLGTQTAKDQSVGMLCFDIIVLVYACRYTCVAGQDWSAGMPCFVVVLMLVQMLVSLVRIGHYDVTVCFDVVVQMLVSLVRLVIMMLCFDVVVLMLVSLVRLVIMMLCFDVVVQMLVSPVRIGQYDVTVCFDVVVLMLVSLVRIGHYDVTVCFYVVVQMLVSLVRIGHYDVTVCFDVVVQMLVSLVRTGHYDVMFWCCCADACVTGDDWSVWCYLLMLLCRCLCRWWWLVIMMLCFDVVVQMLVSLVRIGHYDVTVCFDVVVQMLVSLVRIGHYDVMFWCCCADACVTGEDWSVWCYFLMLLCRCLCRWWWLVIMMLCFDVVVQMLVSLVRIGQYDVMFWCCCADACVAGDDWSLWCYVLMLLCRCLCRWWGLVIMMLCFDVVVQMLVSLVRTGHYDVMFWCCCADACVTGDDWSLWCYVLMLLCRCLCRWWWLVIMMLCFDVVVQMLVSLVRISHYDVMFWCCYAYACVAGEDWSVWCYVLMLLCRCLCHWWGLVSVMLLYLMATFVNVYCGTFIRWETAKWLGIVTSTLDKLTLSLPSSKGAVPNLPKEKCMSEVVRIGSIIISHLSKRWKAKFFTLCDVISLVKLQGKFEVDHSAVPSEQNRSSFWNAPFVKIHWILSCQGLESSQSLAASPDVDTWTTGCGIQET